MLIALSDPQFIQDTCENIRKAQLNDLCIGPILRKMELDPVKPPFREISGEGGALKSLWQNWSNLKIIQGVLYKVHTDPNTEQVVKKLVLPECYKKQVLKMAHDDITSGHLGIAKTKQRLKARFYWWKLRRDVERYVGRCHICSTMKRPGKRRNTPLRPQVFGEPMDRIGIDIVGPLPRTRRINVYIVTMECYFTKWVEAAPVSNISTETVLNVVIRDLISRFGAMRFLHSDQGAQFEAELTAMLCKKLQIVKSRTCSYTPRSNGLVENFNGTLKRMIKCYIDSDRQHLGQWDEMLPYLCMAYRSSVHATTGYTPHYLMTGREMTMPLDLVYGSPYRQEVGIEDYVSVMEKRLQYSYQLARDNLKAAQEVRKKEWSDRVNWPQLTEGGQAYYLNVRKSGKLEPNWVGPYKVIKIHDDLTCTIERNGNKQRVHRDKLMLCRS